jgi:hypothetical protein
MLTSKLFNQPPSRELLHGRSNEIVFILDYSAITNNNVKVPLVTLVLEEVFFDNAMDTNACMQQKGQENEILDDWKQASMKNSLWKT